MAFTQTPTQSTYQTKRMGFVENPQARSGTDKTKDQRIVNFYPELIQEAQGARSKEYTINSRPGTVYSASGGAAAAGRGIVYFNSSLFTVIGTNVYRNGTTMGVTLGTSTGHIGFTQFNGTYTSLILLDGVKGWEIKLDNSITQIVDADFPTPHVPFPVFIDGYLLVAKAGTDDLYNSDLENALSWTPGSFITAELYPDAIVALAKNNNYCYTIGSSTIEFFYDAGIASGSPFQRNDSAVQQFGCPAPLTVVETDKEVVFVGSTNNGGYTIWALEGFNPKEIAYPSLRESLDAEGANIANATAFSVRSNGHKFYVLSLTSRTWVYDFKENLWHEWTYSDNTTKFPFENGCDVTGGSSKLIHNSNGNVVLLSTAVATDQITSSAGINIYSEMTTVKQDMDSMRRKDCSRLTLVGDAPQVSNLPMSVQWSDDDYQTWSTPRTLNINGSYSTITQLGKFRRRAFRFIYNNALPIAIEGYELDLNIGNS